MKITIIGTGNLGSNLAKALYNKGIQIIQVVSKNLSSAKATARIVHAKFTNNLDELKPADLYFICVPDNKIEIIANHKNLSEKTIVHTAGSVDMNILSKNTSNFGVFYPLQTFNKNSNANFSEIPICLEASNNKLLYELELLAMKISDNIYFTNSETRLFAHLSAVIANNFINHLLYLTDNLLSQKEIPKEILFAIIDKTIQNFKTKNLFETQTGPARRNDTQTIQKHLELLDKNNNLKDIYKTITDSISNAYNT